MAPPPPTPLEATAAPPPRLRELARCTDLLAAALSQAGGSGTQLTPAAASAARRAALDNRLTAALQQLRTARKFEPLTQEETRWAMRVSDRLWAATREFERRAPPEQQADGNGAAAPTTTTATIHRDVRQVVGYGLWASCEASRLPPNEAALGERAADLRFGRHRRAALAAHKSGDAQAARLLLVEASALSRDMLQAWPVPDVAAAPDSRARRVFAALAEVELLRLDLAWEQEDEGGGTGGGEGEQEEATRVLKQLSGPLAPTPVLQMAIKESWAQALVRRALRLLSKEAAAPSGGVLTAVGSLDAALDLLGEGGSSSGPADDECAELSQAVAKLRTQALLSLALAHLLSGAVAGGGAAVSTSQLGLLAVPGDSAALALECVRRVRRSGAPEGHSSAAAMMSLLALLSLARDAAAEGGGGSAGAAAAAAAAAAGGGEADDDNNEDDGNGNGNAPPSSSPSTDAARRFLRLAREEAAAAAAAPDASPSDATATLSLLLAGKAPASAVDATLVTAGEAVLCRSSEDDAAAAYAAVVSALLAVVAEPPADARAAAPASSTPTRSRFSRGLGHLVAEILNPPPAGGETAACAWSRARAAIVGSVEADPPHDPAASSSSPPPPPPSRALLQAAAAVRASAYRAAYSLFQQRQGEDAERLASWCASFCPPGSEEKSAGLRLAALAAMVAGRGGAALQHAAEAASVTPQGPAARLLLLRLRLEEAVVAEGEAASAAAAAVAAATGDDDDGRAAAREAAASKAAAATAATEAALLEADALTQCEGASAWILTVAAHEALALASEAATIPGGGERAATGAALRVLFGLQSRLEQQQVGAASSASSSSVPSEAKVLRLIVSLTLQELQQRAALAEGEIGGGRTEEQPLAPPAAPRPSSPSSSSPSSSSAPSPVTVLARGLRRALRCLAKRVPAAELTRADAEAAEAGARLLDRLRLLGAAGAPTRAPQCVWQQAGVLWQHLAEAAPADGPGSRHECKARYSIAVLAASTTAMQQYAREAQQEVQRAAAAAEAEGEDDDDEDEGQEEEAAARLPDALLSAADAMLAAAKDTCAELASFHPDPAARAAAARRIAVLDYVLAVETHDDARRKRALASMRRDERVPAEVVLGLAQVRRPLRTQGGGGGGGGGGANTAAATGPEARLEMSRAASCLEVALDKLGGLGSLLGAGGNDGPAAAPLLGLPKPSVIARSAQVLRELLLLHDVLDDESEATLARLHHAADVLTRAAEARAAAAAAAGGAAEAAAVAAASAPEGEQEEEWRHHASLPRDTAEWLAQHLYDRGHGLVYAPLQPRPTMAAEEEQEAGDEQQQRRRFGLELLRVAARMAALGRPVPFFHGAEIVRSVRAIEAAHSGGWAGAVRPESDGGEEGTGGSNKRQRRA